MIRAGRWLISASLISFLIAQLFMTVSSLKPFLGAFWLNGLAALGSLLGFGAWGMAVYHWYRRYPSDAGRTRWGFLLILLVWLGALMYWFRAAPRAAGYSQNDR